MITYFLQKVKSFYKKNKSISDRKEYINKLKNTIIYFIFIHLIEFNLKVYIIGKNIFILKFLKTIFIDF